LPVALAVAPPVALLIWLATLDSKELAAAPADDVALAATEPSDDVADAMSDASDDSSVVCDPMALPAAEVSELTSETSEESASDWASAPSGLRAAARRSVEGMEKRMVVVVCLLVVVVGVGVVVVDGGLEVGGLFG
jgi:hypothetical protein